jgi:hypothetical protein
MTTTTAPPGLVAVMAPHERRSRQVKILFTPAEHELLSRFAAAAGTPPSYLARSLVFGGLSALLQQADATGCVQGDEAAPWMHETPAIPEDCRGSLEPKNNPEPWQATGSTQGRTNPPMENQQAVGAGGCSAQLTESSAIAATLQ